MDTQASPLHPSRLTDIIEDAVDDRLTPLESFVLDGIDKQNDRLATLEAIILAIKKDRAERDTAAEKMAKARAK
jgi:hypothetical protein